jgi:hypothetical protein
MLWLTAMALQFSTGNRRGLWAPVGETTRDYLDLALERIRDLMDRTPWLTEWIVFVVTTMTGWSMHARAAVASVANSSNCALTSRPGDDPAACSRRRRRRPRLRAKPLKSPDFLFPVVGIGYHLRVRLYAMLEFASRAVRSTVLLARINSLRKRP